MTTTTEKKKSILVTGGNTGIGFALCKQLLIEDNCQVYLGARNVERGRKAVEDIQKMCSNAEKAKDIRFVLIDVSDDTSVKEAATTIKSMLATTGTGTISSSSSSLLYGLVNNADVALLTGLARTGCEDEVLATNFYGPKRVADVFLTLLETQGRIINVSSSAAAIYLRDQASPVKTFFTNPQTTWEELVWKVERRKTLVDGECVYGLSKAALNLLTIQQSKLYRRNRPHHLLCASICPGFMMATTRTTAGWNANNANLVTPSREGTVSIRTCLFSSDIVSGYHYGSDGLRSPLTMTRDPGTPAYEGEKEETIDRHKNKYNNSILLNELGDYANRRAYRMDKKAFGKLHKSNHNKQIGYNNIKPSTPTSKKVVRFWFDNDWRCTTTEVV